jgi:hypothetical protein
VDIVVFGTWVIIGRKSVNEKNVETAETETDSTLKVWRRHLKGRMGHCQVPLTLEGALLDYISLRHPMGDFLMAVVRNDLAQAMARADFYNRERLFQIVDFLYNYAPADCWGSVEKVNTWLLSKEPVAMNFD